MAEPTNETRLSATAIVAAVESADRSGWPGYRSASIATGHCLMLTIRDAHNGDPVRNAWVRGVDLAESKQDGAPPCFEIGDTAFDMPNHDTPYGVPFKRADKDKLDKHIEDAAALVEESIALEQEHASVTTRIEIAPPPPPPLRIRPELMERLSQIEARLTMIWAAEGGLESAIEKLLHKRDTRREWVHAIKALLAVAGRWDEAIDYTEPDGWTSKAGTAFRKVTGRTLWGGSNPRKAVDRLWNAVGKVYKTDRNGVVTIPLPAETEGWVRIEMRHLKLLDPADASNFDPCVSPTCRAEWSGGRDISGDDPTAEPLPEESKWMLVQEIASREEASFRNYLVLPFDTRGLPCTEPILADTLALVWSQIAWMAVGENDYILEAGDRSIYDGRGLTDGHPTCFIPTRGSGSGRRYGEFGNARTIGKDTRGVGTLVEKQILLSGGVWYNWWATWQIAGEYTKKADADAAFEALNEPHKAGHRVATTAEAKGEKTPAGKERNLTLESGTTYVLIRTRDYLAHGASQERAEAAALNRYFLQGLSKRELQVGTGDRAVREVIIPGQKGDAGISWRVVYEGSHSRTPKSRFPVVYRSKLFDDPGDAIETLLNHRFHYGIDIAGTIGDPVFAPVGGTTSVGGSATDHGGGLIVRVRSWVRDEITQVSMCHNDRNVAGTNTLVKAGDVVAIMGRTGNHKPWKQGAKWRGDTGAPTHTHVSVYAGMKFAEMADPLLRTHSFQLPRNQMPHLLPCAGEYEDIAARTTPAASDPRKCKVRHGSGAFDPSAEKAAWKCWAYRSGACPFK